MVSLRAETGTQKIPIKKGQKFNICKYRMMIYTDFT
jgi:hypothetical protein